MWEEEKKNSLCEFPVWTVALDAAEQQELTSDQWTSVGGNISDWEHWVIMEIA